FEGDSIHAVALPIREGPSSEYVAEMTAAAPAIHFRSWNEQAVIVRGADSVLDRREKARPASAAIEFGFGAKERQVAGRTSEQTGAMLVIERAGIWPLRPTLSQHLELFGRQDLLPFRLRLLHLELLGADMRAPCKKVPRIRGYAGQADAGKQRVSSGHHVSSCE